MNIAITHGSRHVAAQPVYAANGKPCTSLELLRECADSVQVLNTHGRISFMNDTFHQAMRPSRPTDVVGRSWWDLWPASLRERLENGFMKALCGQDVSLTLPHNVADDVVQECHFRMRGLRNADQGITSVLVTVADATLRH